MRKPLLPLALLLFAGCGYGPSRLKPGSDMSIPEHVGAGEAILRTLACSARGGDSLKRQPEPTGKAQIRTGCGGVRDTIRR